MTARRKARSPRARAAAKTTHARPRTSRTAPAKPRERPRVRAETGLAPGMQAINIYLAVANIAASMEFLERAFGFERGVVLPGDDGQPRYAEMRHRDSVVMLIRRGDEATASGGAAALYTYVEDVDRALAQAREAGAGTTDAENRPWGDRAAFVTDPDGYRWVLATFKKLAPFT